jgi:hypothetical protein
MDDLDIFVKNSKKDISEEFINHLNLNQMQYLAVLLSVGLPIGIVSAVFITLGRKTNGVWFWTQIYILLYGKRTTATVIDSINKPTSVSINKSLQYLYTVVLDVVDPNSGVKYRIKKKYMDSWYSDLNNKNTELPVIVHTNDNETVIIDFSTIRKNKKESLKRKIDSDENRLNSLMKN